MNRPLRGVQISNRPVHLLPRELFVQSGAPDLIHRTKLLRVLINVAVAFVKRVEVVVVYFSLRVLLKIDVPEKSPGEDEVLLANVIQRCLVFIDQLLSIALFVEIYLWQFL